MNKVQERISIPSSEVIVQLLSLEYDGAYQESNPDATYSFSVPVITDDCPDRLNYFPLNRQSKDFMDEGIDEQGQIKRLEGKNRCVIICRSFDRLNPDTGIRLKLSPSDQELCFIPAFWDSTEDPLMETTLFSCTFLSSAATDGGNTEKRPIFINRKQLIPWLTGKISLNQQPGTFKIDNQDAH